MLSPEDILNRLKELKDVTYTVTCEPEDIPVRGNASAIDEKTDRENEKWIIDQLNRGNDWAWCGITVTAEWSGIKGRDHMGCCSYFSEKDFTGGSDYYPDMKEEALIDLARSIFRAIKAGEELGLKLG